MSPYFARSTPRPTPSLEWRPLSAQPQSVPRVPNPKVSLVCQTVPAVPNPRSVPGVPNPRVSLPREGGDIRSTIILHQHRQFHDEIA